MFQKMILQRKRCFYALPTRGAKPDEGDDEYDGKFLYFFRVMISF